MDISTSPEQAPALDANDNAPTSEPSIAEPQKFTAAKHILQSCLDASQAAMDRCTALQVDFDKSEEPFQHDLERLKKQLDKAYKADRFQLEQDYFISKIAHQNIFEEAQRKRNDEFKEHLSKNNELYQQLMNRENQLDADEDAHYDHQANSMMRHETCQQQYAVHEGQASEKRHRSYLQSRAKCERDWCESKSELDQKFSMEKLSRWRLHEQNALQEIVANIDGLREILKHGKMEMTKSTTDQPLDPPEIHTSQPNTSLGSGSSCLIPDPQVPQNRFQAVNADTDDDHGNGLATAQAEVSEHIVTQSAEQSHGVANEHVLQKADFLWRTTFADQNDEEEDLAGSSEEGAVDQSLAGIPVAQVIAEQTENQSLPQEDPKNASPRRSRGQTVSAVDELQIETVKRLIRELGYDCTRNVLWQRVSDILKLNGYERTPQSCAVKWSSNLRKICEARGYDWAINVMKVTPHKTQRKRQAQEEPTSTTPSNSRRPHKQAKKREPQDPDSDRLTAEQSLPNTSFIGNKIWQGFSHDASDLQWSSDGQRFLAASIAVDEKMEDNRPSNLVLGSLRTSNLREMPDTHHTYDYSHDGHYMYRTVNHVAFSQSGDYGFSSGFDKCVRIWDVRDEDQPRCLSKIKHRGRLEVMSLSKQDHLLATGINDGGQSLKVYHMSSDYAEIRLAGMPYKKESMFRGYPMCLAFGTHTDTSNWLAAGFGWDNDDGSGLYPNSLGRLGVWSIDQDRLTERSFVPNHLQVFALRWFTSRRGFIAGTTNSLPASSQRSCVQFYDVAQPKSYLRLGCPAADINEIKTCPFQENLVVASCSDANTYVWDIRKAKSPVHILSHSREHRVLEPGQVFELEDVGVRMAEWLYGSRDLFTGGSDGLLKRWDLGLSPENVFLEDVYDCDSDIMCGSFSPDRTSLLIGDGNGSLHLLKRIQGKETPVIPTFTFYSAENGRKLDEDRRDVSETSQNVPNPEPLADTPPLNQEDQSSQNSSSSLFGSPITKDTGLSDLFEDAFPTTKAGESAASAENSSPEQSAAEEGIPA